MSIKFSVLIPVYNVEKYLNECVDSVLNQTYPAYEIILLDDGSTDSSGKICDDYAGQNSIIKVFHLQNQGSLFSRLSAIEKADGDFYIFLDSDDYWNNDLLETVNNVICDNNCDMVIFKFNKIYKNKSIELKALFKDKTVFEKENKELIFKEIIRGSALNNLVCKAVKRSIPDNTDYSAFKELRHCEDMLQALPLVYNAERIIYIDKALYNYRTNSESITNTLNLHMFEDFTLARGQLLEYIKKLKMDNDENLTLFYGYYKKRVIKFIALIMCSGISKKQKYDILKKIKNTPLYIDSLNYGSSSLTAEEKICLRLFRNNFNHLLSAFEKAANLLRKFKTLLIKGREH